MNDSSVTLSAASSSNFCTIPDPHLDWDRQTSLADLESEDGGFEPLLAVPEAAELLRVHPKTLQAMARAGTVPCIRMGKYWRFRASALDAWVRERLESNHRSRRVQ